MNPNDNKQFSSSPIRKKLLRATQACTVCRKKKIKCDGTKPKCLHCQETWSSCQYTESRKRGPRKGYVQQLEERLALLERRLVRLGGPAALLCDNDDGSLFPGQSPTSSEPLVELALEKHNTSNFPPTEKLMALVDSFFRFINPVFPIVHKATLQNQIQDGSVSKPLLWSILAMGARYSESPDIRTNPPYLAGEQYAANAYAAIDGATFEPTLPSIQFWSIMACLEYGCASGTKACIYSSLAVRFCQELGWNKEETLSTPILTKDGVIDAVAMALRRCVFWSCLTIDKYTSTGASRPQGSLTTDVDASFPNVPESLVSRDISDNISATNKQITDDSLMDVSRYYLEIVEYFGKVNSIKDRSRSAATDMFWPPVPEYDALDMSLRHWRDNLPPQFQFTPENIDFHKDNAGVAYFSTWLSMHVMWCSSLMVLHRGSLTYGDMWPGDVAPEMYRAIQTSIDTCKLSVRTATDVFQAMRDLRGHNVLPFMGYSAYAFATVLMSSTFSNGPESCRKSNTALKILFDLIDSLSPYWPICKRLATTTDDLIAAHNRLCQPTHQQPLPYDQSSMLYVSPIPIALSDTTTAVPPPATSSNVGYAKDDSWFSQYQVVHSQPNSGPLLPVSPGLAVPPSPPNDSFESVQEIISSNALPNNYGVMRSGIDFDSMEVLNDSALSGQIMFDGSRLPMYLQSG